MKLTRRESLTVGGAAAALAFLPGMGWTDAAGEALQAFTNGATAGEGAIDLIAPEIAENGNTVPVEVAAEGAVAIMLLATGNPQPNVMVSNFGPASGASRISARMRLAGTQDVTAVAKMSDGTFVQTTKSIKVTIGGCGG